MGNLNMIESLDDEATLGIANIVISLFQYILNLCSMDSSFCVFFLNYYHICSSKITTKLT